MSLSIHSAVDLYWVASCFPGSRSERQRLGSKAGIGPERGNSPAGVSQKMIEQFAVSQVCRSLIPNSFLAG
jgi:hypothetical protein